MNIVNKRTAPSTAPGHRYVGRGSPLGNPYRIGEHGSRDQVVDRYAADMAARYERGDPALITTLRGLAGAEALVCWCAPERCHAEVIRDYFQRLQQDGLPCQPVRAYAGIGSRETPPEVLKVMAGLASKLARRGFVLRSGGAEGADTAFEQGASDAQAPMEIFLPWRGFQSRVSPYMYPSNEAAQVAEAVHPRWDALSRGARALQARNSHQVLGADLRSPASFVVCWTRCGAESETERSIKTGGTGQAIALASRWSVPVFNLARPDALTRLQAFLQTI